MSEQDVQDLIEAASAALSRVPPNEETHQGTVGAACLSRDGKIFTGVNIFHFTGGPCAEPVALCTAASNGVLPADVRLMVAMKYNKHHDRIVVINPCGRCRQQMIDLSPAIKVIVIDEDATLKVVGIEELLPFSFVINRGKEIEVAEG